jgi:hypothetical protein
MNNAHQVHIGFREEAYWNVMMLSWFWKLLVTKKKKAHDSKHLIISYYCLNFDKDGKRVVVDWLNAWR